MARSMLLTIEPLMVAQAVTPILRLMNPKWTIPARWGSSQELWQELRPFVFGDDGQIDPKTLRAFNKIGWKGEMGHGPLGVLMLRIAVVRWANKEMGL